MLYCCYDNVRNLTQETDPLNIVSMPGIMSTIHNVGESEELVEEYVALHPERRYFAWDNFRRLQQSWGMCRGMDREEFQVLMNAHKAKYKVHYKREFSPEAIIATSRPRASGCRVRR